MPPSWHLQLSPPQNQQDKQSQLPERQSRSPPLPHMSSP